MSNLPMVNSKEGYCTPGIESKDGNFSSVVTSDDTVIRVAMTLLPPNGEIDCPQLRSEGKRCAMSGYPCSDKYRRIEIRP